MEVLRAKYTYESKNPDELAFKANEEVTLIHKTDTAGWWLVENKHNKKGLVPANYFDTISPPDSPATGPPSKPPPGLPPSVPNGTSSPVLVTPVVSAPLSSSGPKTFDFPNDGKERAVAQEDYTAKDASQLSFKKDDVIIVLQKFPTGWYQGEVNGARGVFPVKTIKLLSEIIQEDKKKHRRSRSASNRDKAEKRKTRTLTIGAQLKPDFAEEGDEGSDEDDTPSIYNLSKIAGSSSDPKPTAVVLHKYVAQDSTQLGLEPGEVITILAKSDNGWWTGEKGGKVGHFPGSYVKDQAASQSSSASNTPPSKSPRASVSLEGRKATALYPYPAASHAELSLSMGDELVVLPLENSNGWLTGYNVKDRSKVGHFPAGYIKFEEVTESGKKGWEKAKNATLGNGAKGHPTRKSADNTNDDSKAKMGNTGSVSLESLPSLEVPPKPNRPPAAAPPPIPSSAPPKPPPPAVPAEPKPEKPLPALPPKGESTAVPTGPVNTSNAGGGGSFLASALAKRASRMMGADSDSEEDEGHRPLHKPPTEPPRPTLEPIKPQELHKPHEPPKPHVSEATTHAPALPPKEAPPKETPPAGGPSKSGLPPRTNPPPNTAGGPKQRLSVSRPNPVTIDTDKKPAPTTPAPSPAPAAASSSPSGDADKAIEQLKTAMIRLQQQTKAAMEDVAQKLDAQNKERLKLEYVMRDMKTTMKEEKDARIRVEQQNRVLYQEIQQLKARLAGADGQDGHNDDFSLMSANEMRGTLRTLRTHLDQEVRARQDLQALVSRLQDDSDNMQRQNKRQSGVPPPGWKGN